jgi:hypothetical protein
MLKKIEDYYFSCRLATEFVLRWKAQGPTELVFNFKDELWFLREANYIHACIF